MLPRTTCSLALYSTAAGLGALTTRRTLEQATSLDVIGLQLALVAGGAGRRRHREVQVDDDLSLARSSWVIAS